MPTVTIMAIDVRVAAVLFVCLTKEKMAYFCQMHKDTMSERMGVASSTALSLIDPIRLYGLELWDFDNPSYFICRAWSVMLSDESTLQ